MDVLFLRRAARAAALSLFCIVLVGSFSVAAWSQPARTIRLVVPFPAGGSADTLARLLGDQISKSQGLTIVVENRPGAGASIGYEMVARAAPNGNTLVIAANSLVINTHVKKTSYDAMTSFAPVCYLVSSPQVFVVNSASPYFTLNDLIISARARPGTLTLASIGPGTTQHIGFEQFKRATKAEITHIPYAGGAPAVNALLGGHVTSVLANYSEVIEQLNAGKLRALATASRTRLKALPEVPTVREYGYADYEVDVWFGLLAPAHTPVEITSQLADWFGAAMKDGDVERKLVALGLYPVGLCGADFANHIRDQYQAYGRIIRDADIKAD